MSRAFLCPKFPLYAMIAPFCDKGASMPAQVGEKTEFRCEVKEVFSGDDLIAMIDLGVENLWRKQRIRLAGVDTPNAVKEGVNTPAGVIRTYIRNLTRGKPATLTVEHKNVSSWVVTLIVQTPTGPVNVNEYLISQGFQFKGKVTQHAA